MPVRVDEKRLAEIEEISKGNVPEEKLEELHKFIPYRSLLADACLAQFVPDLLADLREARAGQRAEEAALEQLRGASGARALALQWLRDRLNKSEQSARRARSSYSHSNPMGAACELLALLDDMAAERCRAMIARLETP